MSNNRILFSSDFVLKDGKIGINTADPQSLLDVAGDVRISGVSTFSSNVDVGESANIGNNLNVSGVSTLGTLEINSGILTATSGIITYYGQFNGNLTGIADTASFATTSYTLEGKFESELNVSTAVTSKDVVGGIASISNLSVSGVSTLGTLEINSGIVTASSGIITYYGEFNGNLAGNRITSGIASISNLSVSGVSTLGTIRLSSGIVTSTSGVVTYYGDGSNLTGIRGVQINVQPITSDPTYPLLASGIGVNTVGLSTGNLVFIPSLSRLGIGTTIPAANLDVAGTLRITSGGIYTTTIQSVTQTQNRVINLPNQDGTVALISGVQGQISFNDIDKNSVGNLFYSKTKGTFGYSLGGGTVVQSTDKATSVTLNKPCGRVTMSAATLNANTTVEFQLNNTSIDPEDLLILNHVSGGSNFGSYLLNARAGSGFAIISVRNARSTNLSENITIGFAVIKSTTV